jgi:protein AATF/BFR2
LTSYEVHEKLQNFMVPVPVKGSWHDEQIDELFASLLGKGFENAVVYGTDGDNRDAGAEKSLEVELGEALKKGGFRVFG